MTQTFEKQVKKWLDQNISKKHKIRNAKSVKKLRNKLKEKLSGDNNEKN